MQTNSLSKKFSGFSQKRFQFRFRKTVSLLATFFFTMTTLLGDNLLWAQSAYLNTGNEVTGEGFSLTHVPVEFGRVRELYQPESAEGPFVLHIQDAHANKDAQQNIAAILDWVQNNRSIVVGLEGAVSDIHPEYLNLFPDYAEANDAVVRDLVEKGELNGTELFAWNQRNAKGEPAFKVVGAEDAALYSENLLNYRTLVYAQDEIESLLQPYRKNLEIAKSRILSPELRSFIRERERRKYGNYAGDASSPQLNAYLTYLAQTVRKELQIDLENNFEQIRFPNLYRVLVMGQIQKNLDSRKAAREKQKALDALRKAAANDADREAVDQLANLVKGMPAREIVETAWNLSLRGKVNLTDYHYYLLELGMLVLNAEIEAEQLFSEVEILENALIQSWIHNEDEAALIQILNDFDLTAKLLNLKWTTNDLEAFESRRDEVLESAFNGRLEALAVKTGDGSSIQKVEMKPELENYLNRAVSFYEGAEARDRALLEKTIAAAGPGDVAVLVTGGFHTEGLTSLMRENGNAYAVVQPNILFNDMGKTYERALREENADVSAYFQQPALTKQESIFFKSLVETAAPALFEKYGVSHEDIGAKVAHVLNTHPVLSKRLAARALKADKRSRVDFRVNGVANEAVAIAALLQAAEAFNRAYQQVQRDEADAALVAASALQGRLIFQETRGVQVVAVPGLPSDFEAERNEQRTLDVSLSDYASVEAFRDYMLEKRIPELVAAHPELKELYAAYVAAFTAGSTDEVKALEKQINAIIDAFNAVKTSGIYADHVGDFDLATLRQADLNTIEQVYSDAEYRQIDELIVSGAYAPEFFAAGAASRLGLGNMFTLSLPEFEAVLRDPAQKLDGLDEAQRTAIADRIAEVRAEAPEYADTPLGVRLLLNFKADVIDAVYRLNPAATPADIDQALANQSFSFLLNEAVADDVIQLFIDNDFFGFNRDNVFLTVQPAFHGYAIDGDSVTEVTDQGKIVNGHGYPTMQKFFTGQAFRIDGAGQRVVLGRPLTDELIAQGVKLLGIYRINDMSKYEFGNDAVVGNAIDRNTLIASVQVLGGFENLDRIDVGADQTVELVDNPTKQKGGLFPATPTLKAQGLGVMPDTLAFKDAESVAAIERMEDEIGKGLAYNAMRQVYKAASLRSDNPALKGIPAYVRFRAFSDGQPNLFAAETVTGDTTYFLKTAAVSAPGRVIRDFKTAPGIGDLVERFAAQNDRLRQLGIPGVRNEQRTFDNWEDYYRAVHWSQPFPTGEAAELVKAVFENHNDYVTAFVNDDLGLLLSTFNTNQNLYREVKEKALALNTENFRAYAVSLKEFITAVRRARRTPVVSVTGLTVPNFFQLFEEAVAIEAAGTPYNIVISGPDEKVYVAKRLGPVSVSLSDYASVDAFRDYMLEKRIPELVAAHPELKELYASYVAAFTAGKADEAKALEKQINAIIDAFNAVKSSGIYADHVGDFNLATLRQADLNTIALSYSDEEYRQIDELIVSGAYAPEFFAAGAASRLGLGNMFTLSLPEFERVLRDPAQKLDGLDEAQRTAIADRIAEVRAEAPEYADTPLGVRLLLNFKADVIDAVYRLNPAATPADIEEALANQSFSFLLNEAVADDVIQLFIDNDFFGFNRDNVFLTVQPAFHGYAIDGNDVEEITDQGKIVNGHGYPTMQKFFTGQAFRIDGAGQRVVLGRPLTDELIAQGVKLLGIYRINDMSKYEFGNDATIGNAIDRNTLIASVQVLGGFENLDRIDVGADQTVELVDNPNKQKGGLFPATPALKAQGLGVMPDTLAFKDAESVAAIERMEGEIGKGLAYNAMRQVYKVASLRSDNPALKGVPAYIRFRAFSDGQPNLFAAETVTGDTTYFLKTAAVSAPDREIRDFKTAGEIKKLIERFAAQNGRLRDLGIPGVRNEQRTEYTNLQDLSGPGVSRFLRSRGITDKDLYESEVQVFTDPGQGPVVIENAALIADPAPFTVLDQKLANVGDVKQIIVRAGVKRFEGEDDAEGIRSERRIVTTVDDLEDAIREFSTKEQLGLPSDGLDVLIQNAREILESGLNVALIPAQETQTATKSVEVQLTYDTTNQAGEAKTMDDLQYSGYTSPALSGETVIRDELVSQSVRVVGLLPVTKSDENYVDELGRLISARLRYFAPWFEIDRDKLASLTQIAQEILSKGSDFQIGFVGENETLSVVPATRSQFKRSKFVKGPMGLSVDRSGLNKYGIVGSRLSLYLKELITARDLALSDVFVYTGSGAAPITVGNDVLRGSQNPFEALDENLKNVREIERVYVRAATVSFHGDSETDVVRSEQRDQDFYTKGLNVSGPTVSLFLLGKISERELKLSEVFIYTNASQGPIVLENTVFKNENDPFGVFNDRLKDVGEVERILVRPAVVRFHGDDVDQPRSEQRGLDVAMGVKPGDIRFLLDQLESQARVLSDVTVAEANENVIRLIFDAVDGVATTIEIARRDDGDRLHVAVYEQSGERRRNVDLHLGYKDSALVASTELQTLLHLSQDSRSNYLDVNFEDLTDVRLNAVDGVTRLELAFHVVKSRLPLANRDVAAFQANGFALNRFATVSDRSEMRDLLRPLTADDLQSTQNAARLAVETARGIQPAVLDDAGRDVTQNVTAGVYSKAEDLAVKLNISLDAALALLVNEVLEQGVENEDKFAAALEAMRTEFGPQFVEDFLSRTGDPNRLVFHDVTNESLANESALTLFAFTLMAQSQNRVYVISSPDDDDDKELTAEQVENILEQLKSEISRLGGNPAVLKDRLVLKTAALGQFDAVRKDILREATGGQYADYEPVVVARERSFLESFGFVPGLGRVDRKDIQPLESHYLLSAVSLGQDVVDMLMQLEQQGYSRESLAGRIGRFVAALKKISASA